MAQKFAVDAPMRVSAERIGRGGVGSQHREAIGRSGPVTDLENGSEGPVIHKKLEGIRSNRRRFVPLFALTDPDLAI